MRKWVDGSMDEIGTASSSWNKDICLKNSSDYLKYIAILNDEKNVFGGSEHPKVDFCWSFT